MLDEVAPDSFSYTSGNSFRNGMCGYKNKEVFNISYNSRAEYVKDIKKLISQEKLINEKEYYSPIRLKAKDNTNLLKSIEEDGIEYLEVRLLDLNPMIKTGISIDQLYFVHLFLLFCLFTDEDSLTEKEIWEGNKNHELVAHYGRKADLELFNQGEFKFLKDLGLDIISKMEKIVEDLGISDLNYINTLREAVESFHNTDLLISSKIESGIREEGFIEIST